MEQRKCAGEGCNRKVNAHGMCLMHYKRLRKNGDMNVVQRPQKQMATECSVEGCTSRPIGKGFCMNHYALMRRNGAPVRTKIFTGVYIKDGYRYVMVGRRHYEPEHRLVVERCLGRKLATSEQVHHIDGDTLNNSPSNLQIVTRSEHLKIHIKGRPRGYRGRFAKAS